MKKGSLDEFIFEAVLLRERMTPRQLVYSPEEEYDFLAETRAFMLSPKFIETTY